MHLFLYLFVQCLFILPRLGIGRLFLQRLSVLDFVHHTVCYKITPGTACVCVYMWESVCVCVYVGTVCVQVCEYKHVWGKHMYVWVCACVQLWARVSGCVDMNVCESMHKWMGDMCECMLVNMSVGEWLCEGCVWRHIGLGQDIVSTWEQFVGPCFEEVGILGAWSNSGFIVFFLLVPVQIKSCN
jgi:hypothetical protein